MKEDDFTRSVKGNESLLTRIILESNFEMANTACKEYKNESTKENTLIKRGGEGGVGIPLTDVTATSMSLFQARTWISKVICRDLFLFFFEVS